MNVPKDYVCDTCGKSYAQAGDLRKHVKAIHEGTKDHICNSCGKGFTHVRYDFT